MRKEAIARGVGPEARLDARRSGTQAGDAEGREFRAIVTRDDRPGDPHAAAPAVPVPSAHGGPSPMFAYIDPTVSNRLVDQGKLVRIDRHGRCLDLTDPPPPGSRAIDVMGPIPLPLHVVGGGELEASWYAAVRHTELEPVDELARSLRERGAVRRFASIVSHMSVNSVLVFGDLARDRAPLVRVHSNCLTGDVFGSQRCDCGPQLGAAIRQIADTGGMVVYMAGHEGRGIGLWAKAATYVLQDGGESTYQANRSLGLPDDSRDFSDAAALLLYFLGEDRPFRLLTNNPKKADDLRFHGLRHVTVEKHVIGVGEHNRRYLAAKRDWGHSIEDGDLGLEPATGDGRETSREETNANAGGGGESADSTPGGAGGVSGAT